MRIIWSATAVANLVEIRDYIEEDSPASARRVAKKIVQAAEKLARHPYLGHPGREPGTREFVVAGTPYIIPYQVRRARLVILAVLHAARHRPPR